MYFSDFLSFQEFRNPIMVPDYTVLLRLKYIVRIYVCLRIRTIVWQSILIWVCKYNFSNATISISSGI